MLENIEQLGSEGEVEQAQAMMKLSDQLKEEREQLQAQKGGVGFRDFLLCKTFCEAIICCFINYFSK